MKRSIFILFAILFFVFSPHALAQLGSAQSDINITMIPEDPKPNQSVVVNLTSYITDINYASISWSINGKVVKSGTGEKSFTFTAGPSGSNTTLGIRITTKEGQSINKTIAIKPVNIDLIWQSESYVPPFYRGKAQFSYQNKITFIAIPHFLGSNGAEISPKNLVYTWTQNGTVQQNDSGYGKNTFAVIPTVIARPLNVTVDVSTSDGNTAGFALTSVAPSDPFVLFYKKSPIYGTEFQKALTGTVEMTDSNEMLVTAVPYFFGTTDQNEALSYSWSINGRQIDDDLSQVTRVFRQVEGTSGVSSIAVKVLEDSKILQLGIAQFDLKFGTPPADASTF